MHAVKEIHAKNPRMGEISGEQSFITRSTVVNMGVQILVWQSVNIQDSDFFSRTVIIALPR